MLMQTRRAARCPRRSPPRHRTTTSRRRTSWRTAAVRARSKTTRTTPRRGETGPRAAGSRTDTRVSRMQEASHGVAHPVPRLAEQVAAMHAQALREEGVQRHRGLLEAVDGNPRRRVRPPWCLRRPS